MSDIPTGSCPRGHDMTVYGVGYALIDKHRGQQRRTKWVCQRCHALANAVWRLRHRHRTTEPATDAERWQMFCRDVEARIALIRADEGYDSRVGDRGPRASRQRCQEVHPAQPESLDRWYRCRLCRRQREAS